MPSVKSAFKTWSDYSGYVEDSVHLTHEGHAYLALVPEVLAALDSEAQEIERAQFRADRAKREIEDGFWMLHAHSLLGLWSAFETLIGDIFVSRIVENPSILEQEIFRKYKLPAALFANRDIEEVSSALFELVCSNGNLGTAPGRYEYLLSAVGLGGTLPARVSKLIHRSQSIRNLCAHRGGVVDAKFLQHPDGNVLGARVNLSTREFLPLMHSMHMYSLIILNRLQVEQGEQIRIVDCAGFEGVMAAAFPVAPNLE